MTSARNPIFSLNEHNALRFLIQPLRFPIFTLTDTATNHSLISKHVFDRVQL